MSAGGPESIPTSQDRLSRRPAKKRALTPNSVQAASLDALFAKPDQEIRTDRPQARAAPLPPDIVTNVQGSSAGAGSGEFHVYKAARRREADRLRRMDEEARKEKEQEEFEREKRARESKDDEKTRKNREKREKMKARKAKARSAAKSAGNRPNDSGDATEDAADVKAASALADVRVNAPKDSAAPAAPSSGTHNGKGDGPAEDAEAEGLIIHDDD
ncbi:hypothetical protein jhhlp_002193 [Lomentospora prolificans]|uniref:DUF1168 domain protein n=1 Tax=Lomentospora prolificans TaxID=41688 RepID=A0A2N3NDK8_9PEZI|nr:hypothetical protein jhhlp_002193 [Lomentospora prolificans]